MCRKSKGFYLFINSFQRNVNLVSSNNCLLRRFFPPKPCFMVHGFNFYFRTKEEKHNYNVVNLKQLYNKLLKVSSWHLNSAIYKLRKIELTTERNSLCHLQILVAVRYKVVKTVHGERVLKQFGKLEELMPHFMKYKATH